MIDAHNAEQRITELEIKVSFMDELVDKLDQVIIRQQARLDALQREILLLRDQALRPQGGEPRNLRDDLPPHY